MCCEIKINPPAFGHILGISYVSYQIFFHSQWKAIPFFRKLFPSSENGHVAWLGLFYGYAYVCPWPIVGNLV